MSWLDELWDSTGWGRNQQAVQSRRIGDQLKLYAATNNPKEKAKILAGIQQDPAFAKLQEQMAAVQASGQKPASVLSPGEEAANKGYDQLNPVEQKQLVLNPRGYGRGKTVDPLVQGAVDIGKIRKARDNFSEKELSPETASYFDVAEQSVKDRTGFRDPEINPKTGKPRRVFSQSGEVIGTRNADGTSTTPKGKIVDNRDLFSTGVNPFDDGTKAKAKAKASAADKEVKNMQDFIQSGTETVPEDTIPKTRKQIGADTNKQAEAQYEEIKEFAEKAQKQGELVNFNVEQSYQENKDSFNLLFKAMREGIPDGQGGKRKMTKKEWLEALRSMGR